MQVKFKYVPRHKTKGYFLDQYSQPVDSYMQAIKFNSTEDDYAKFMMGRYRPDNPLDFYPARLKITYELEPGGIDLNFELEDENNERSA